MDDSPNSPNFPTAKYFHYMVHYLSNAMHECPNKLSENMATYGIILETYIISSSL